MSMNHLFAQEYFDERFKKLESEMLDANVFMDSLSSLNASASSPSSLAMYVVQSYDEIALWGVFSDFLEQMFRNMIHHFPENIFWDLDYMIAYVIGESLKFRSPEKFWEDYTCKLNELLETFGCYGEIRFRYLHDFTYGFVWSGGFVRI